MQIVAKKREISNRRPLRGKLRCRFEDHFGQLETRDDHSNPFNRIFIVFHCRNICAIQTDNDGREENWSSDEDQGLNYSRQRFEWAVGGLSAGHVNDVSELEGTAQPNPQAGQLGKKRCLQPQRNYKRE